jgi:hypothetical protein
MLIFMCASSHIIMAAPMIAPIINNGTIQVRLQREREALDELVANGLLSFYDIQEVTDPAKKFVFYAHVDVYLELNDAWYLRFESSDQWYPCVQPPTVKVLRFDGAVAPNLWTLFNEDNVVQMYTIMTANGGWATKYIADFVRLLFGIVPRTLRKYKTNCLRNRCSNVDARCNNLSAYDAVTLECIPLKFCWRDEDTGRCYDIRALHQAFKARPGERRTPDQTANMPLQLLETIADPYEGVEEQ